MSEFLKENRERILEGYKKIKEQFPGVFEETDKQIEKFCPVDAAGAEFMERAYDSFGISARRYSKILKVARTLADFEERQVIKTCDLAAAFHFTRLLKGGAKE